MPQDKQMKPAREAEMAFCSFMNEKGCNPLGWDTLSKRLSSIPFFSSIGKIRWQATGVLRVH